MKVLIMDKLNGGASAIVVVLADHPVVAATWALVLFPLAYFMGLGALVYSRRRQRYVQCPECAETMPAQVVRCRSCGHHFAAR